MRCISFPFISALALILFFPACKSKQKEKLKDGGPKADTEIQSSAKTKADPMPHTRDWDAIGVKGKVASITQTLYHPDGKGGKRMLAQKNVFLFEPFGNKKEFRYYNHNGDLVSITRFRYNDDFKLVAEELYLANGTLDTRHIIKTDDVGRKKEQQTLRQDGSTIMNTRYTFEYDSLGRMTTWTCYYSSGPQMWKYEYRYDKKGNRTEWKILDANNNPTRIYKYVFNTNNLITEETISKPDGTVEAKYTYTYTLDKQGNWITKFKYEKGQLLEVYERELVYY
jgi:hypothetical protein